MTATRAQQRQAALATIRERVGLMIRTAERARAEVNDLRVADVAATAQATRVPMRDAGRNARAREIQIAERRAVALEQLATDARLALSVAEAKYKPNNGRKKSASRWSA